MAASPTEEARFKPMLSVKEQVAHLERKGVRFELCAKPDAADYLRRKNNFYKVASYRKLFDVRRGGLHDGEYANLDFAYLKDLAAIDRQLRFALLPMTLDIEHFAKVKLLRLASENDNEDGYSIVRDYLASLAASERNRRERELDIMAHDPFCGDMVSKYRDELPVWVFLEASSFGAFIDFYRFCAARWRSAELKDEHYLLRRTKSVRNAAAHSSNLVNGFGGRSSAIKGNRTVFEALANTGISQSQRKSKMGNAAIQNIVSALYAHTRLVEGKTSRQDAKKSLQGLALRMDMNTSYYAKNDAIRSSFDFLKKVFDSWFFATR